jgi:hypothetical protein
MTYRAPKPISRQHRYLAAVRKAVEAAPVQERMGLLEAILFKLPAVYRERAMAKLKDLVEQGESVAA